MIISAKFASICPACGQRIVVGSRVEWSSGSKARHAKCQSRTSTTAAASPSAVVSATAEAPFVACEKWEPCKRSNLRNAVGETRVYTKRQPARRDGVPETVAHPTSGVYVVVAQNGRYENAEDNEDMGDCSGAGWQMTLLLRAATAEETEKAQTDRLGRAIPAIGAAIATFVRQAAKTLADQRMVEAAQGPDAVRVELWGRHEPLKGPTDQTVLWEGERGSYRSAYRIDGQLVYEAYDYVYDWDLPRVFVGPRAILEPLAVAEAICAFGVSLKHFVRENGHKT